MAAPPLPLQVPCRLLSRLANYTLIFKQHYARITYMLRLSLSPWPPPQVLCRLLGRAKAANPDASEASSQHYLSLRLDVLPATEALFVAADAAGALSLVTHAGVDKTFVCTVLADCAS